MNVRAFNIVLLFLLCNIVFLFLLCVSFYRYGTDKMYQGCIEEKRHRNPRDVSFWRCPSRLKVVGRNRLTFTLSVFDRSEFIPVSKFRVLDFIDCND